MSTSPQKLRIAIADDHEIFTLALTTLIQSYDNLYLSGIYFNGRLLVDAVEELQPDIILMDVRMPELDGIEACRVIHQSYPDIKIVAISDYDEGIVVHQMFESGAHSFFTKHVQRKPFEDLLNCIIEDKRYISPAAAANYAFYNNQLSRGKVIPQQPSEKQVMDAKSIESYITPREKEVIVCLAKGYTNKDIAKKLSVSIRTIDSHKRHIFEKMGIKKVTEAVALAYQLRWL